MQAESGSLERRVSTEELLISNIIHLALSEHRLAQLLWIREHLEPLSIIARQIDAFT
jgi:hypothetical protein